MVGKEQTAEGKLDGASHYSNYSNAYRECLSEEE
jgi:hypothetical protein